jgi:ubiquinone/menaquinone biosynthesis C-methylase UbiE
MNYKEFSNLTQSLIYSDIEESKKIKMWKEIQEKISNSKSHSRHISKLIEILKSKNDAVILDHGCGSCSTILYLLCLDYKNIWGVDISCDEKKLNFFLKTICQFEEKRIFNYDGKILPFENNKFDLIISQQVLEHVKYEYKEITIKEQSRVMKIGAYAYYQIPHLLVPYEAHTKTWLIHWLPRKIALLFYKVINKNFLFFKNHLFLSLPFKYKRLIKKEIGVIDDLSVERVSMFNNEFNEFKGLSLFIRLSVAKICRLPFIGKIIVKIVSNFIMIEILAVKNDRS